MTIGKFVIVIPVYNEEEIIIKIIQEILEKFKKLNYEIIILNDGSTDNTLNKLKIFEKLKNISIINKMNEGHGKTLLKGYEIAVSKNVEFILQIDGDDQIPLDEFFKIIRYFDNGDLICGYRHNRYDPFLRLLTSKFLKIFILLKHRVLINDSNVPFRIIKKNFLKENLFHLMNSNVPNILLSILAAKKKKIVQIKTLHRERNTGVISIRRFKLLVFCLKTFWEIFKFRIVIKKWK